LREEAAKADKEKAREAIPKLARLCFYDLRHQAITEMLEAGTPEGVIREVAGHVDPAMARNYSHPSLAARKAAVEALSIAGQSPTRAELEAGYVTSCVTKALPEVSEASQVSEKNGTPGGIRTPDLLLRRQPLYPSELQAHLNRV
jgi:Phage integrase family